MKVLPVWNDRSVLAVAVGSALAWAYVAWLAWGMAHMDVGAQMLLMPAMVGWQAKDLGLVFLMWLLMMAAMMLPSALPMLMCFVALGRRTRPPRPRGDAMAFVAGYLAVWAGFSAAATLAQWALLEARLVSPMMEVASPVLGAALLLLAGAWQFSRLKARCLAQCRSPLDFLTRHWRTGLGGALHMGWRHGLFCVGCCWALMALLFVLGVMNLAWIAALALWVLLEKTLPVGSWLLRASGAAFIAWGLYLLLAAL